MKTHLLGKDINSPTQIVYNFGCGDNRINGAINVDVNPNFKPDAVMNFLEPLPIESDTVDVIYFLHVVEHISKKNHPFIFGEFYRILKQGGVICIAYPEFTRCAMNYINNVKGQRDFWEATIYGRQSTEFDYHVSLMDSTRFGFFLKLSGFEILENRPEIRESFNSIMICRKGQRLMTAEEDFGSVLKHEYANT